MKILQLRFKNLNSLVGEWEIDFTSPSYQEDGIFAISGTTGAGKTTILDAICLGLYGQTPRLKNITGSTNEIMSRQTGECFAEVVFETGRGSFRAHWSQRRARGKPDGQLQQPQHEISEADTGKIIAAQLNKTKVEVEAITGMDFTRFTQSMMLAQGNFAVFLQAAANERAPILEQITGTEIYSTISVKAFERSSEENKILEGLKAQSAGIIILTAEKEQEILENLEKKQRGKRGYDKTLDRLRAAYTWKVSINDTELELEGLQKQEALLAEETEAFSSDRQRLERGLQALNLGEDHAQLETNRKHQHEETAILDELNKGTSALEIALQQNKTEAELSASQLKKTRESQEALLKVTREVRSIDQQIMQIRQLIEKLKDEEGKAIKVREENEGNKAATLKSIDEYNSRREKIRIYREEHPSDALLVEELTGINASIKSLLSDQEALDEATGRLARFRKEHQECMEGIPGLEGAMEKISADLEAATLNVTGGKQMMETLLGGRSIGEVSQRKDFLVLRLAELLKIAAYQDDRGRLEDGKPCPLCGSLSHPWAEGNVPLPTETEKELAEMMNLIKEYDRLAEKQQENEQAVAILARELRDAGHHLDIARGKQQGLLQQVQQQEEETSRLHTRVAEAGSLILNSLSPLGITHIPSTKNEVTALLAGLEKRLKTWKDAETNDATLLESLREAEGMVKANDSVIAVKAEEIRIKQKEISEQEALLQARKKERHELFGEKDPDAEEALWQRMLHEAQKHDDDCRSKVQDSANSLQNHTTRIADLEVSTQKRQTMLETNTRSFLVRLAENGFADEADYLAGKLSEEERKRLEKSSGDLQERSVQLKTKRDDLQKKLHDLSAKHLTDEDAEALQAQIMELQELLNEATKQAGALEEKLRQNEQSKAEGETIMALINKQAAVAERWARLSRLIGSADGKKFRNFAQGLTLEIMVSHANRQLAKLSDRYLLTRDPSEPLELRVIDNYQAGVVRTTKNLSGGESFIVSLALALGLSGMASRNVRVDSLFLDEGFGTLDEDTLEAALATLASLRQEGKMIGMISHVGALKERVSTQIVVTPVREGKSVISGPGCRKCS